MTTDPRYSKLRGRNILIVEDEVLVAMMMEDILLEQGCTPLVAGEQKEALACLDGGRFDAAILDVNLNGEIVECEKEAGGCPAGARFLPCSNG